MAQAKTAPTSRVSRVPRASGRPAATRVQQCVPIAMTPMNNAIGTRPSPGTTAAGANSKITMKASSAANGAGLSGAGAAVAARPDAAVAAGRHHSTTVLPTTPFT